MIDLLKKAIAFKKARNVLALENMLHDAQGYPISAEEREVLILVIEMAMEWIDMECEIGDES